MERFLNLRLVRNNPGLMTVYFDMPGRPVNVLDESVLRDLDGLVSELEQDQELNLVVFRSGKESGFLAGADVKRMHEIRSAAEAESVLRAGQQLFDRIAALRMPTLAVIHGPCLGGGLEFALSCTWRIARDDSSTRLGLPETQLGVIPGWGGTQRLPRLVGLESALRMILEAQRLPASKALKIGLVDRVLPHDHFDKAINGFVTERLAGKPVRRPRRSLRTRLLNQTRAGQWVILRVARKRLGLRGSHYPALPAAMRAIETGLRYGHKQGLAAEREEFCRVLLSPACRRLIELFFLREKARKPSTWCDTAAAPPQAVTALAVLGAGTMGAGIAQLAACQGYDVVLKDIRQDLVDAGLTKIESLMAEAVGKGAFSPEEGEQHLHAIAGTTGWESIASVGVAIEAVVERMEIKREVFQDLDRRLPPEALIVSNTSSLPIAEMAAATDRPAQVAGLHFFNPVHRMALVEVVRAAGTHERTIATLVELVRNLGKTPIVVRDAPGFLVNRILFPYLDEAVRLLCEGFPAEEIDHEAERFGMPMGPLELLDQVGIDIAAEVARTLLPLSAEESPSVQRFADMVQHQRLGRKTGTGFYAYPKGRKSRAAVDRPAPASPPQRPKPAWFADGEVQNGVALRLVLAMINEAAECLDQRIVSEPWMVDLAMVLGTGFAPFRGGPLRLADSWDILQVSAALDRLAETCGPRFKPCTLLREMAQEHRTFYTDTPPAPAARPVAGASSAPV